MHTDITRDMETPVYFLILSEQNSSASELHQMVFNYAMIVLVITEEIYNSPHRLLFLNVKMDLRPELGL
jgi:heme/copper-type cytochrome/quinol oxidase subunit 4